MKILDYWKPNMLKTKELIMVTRERHEVILKVLDEKQRVYTNDLAKQFNISVGDILKDLSVLEEQGLLKTTYDGALALSKNTEENVQYKIESIERKIIVKAINEFLESGYISASQLQVNFNIGHRKALDIIGHMENLGVISNDDSSKRKKIIISKNQWKELEEELRI